MISVCGSLFFLAFIGGSFGRSVDLTVNPYSIGDDVVQATADRIGNECIFPDDKLFLKRVAFVQTEFGKDSKTFRHGYYGGIWQVDETMFLETSSCVGNLSHVCHQIKMSFNITWQTVQWQDLVKPIYSALAFKLYVELRQLPAISGSITNQALTWGMVFHKQAKYTDYITKLASTHTAECDLKLDLVFVIDTSNGTSMRHFDGIKSFLKNVLDKFVIAPEKTRVGIVRSRVSLHPDMYLNTFNAAVQTGIDNLPYGHMNANIEQAITTAYEKVFTTDMGMRDEAVKVMFLITNNDNNNNIVTEQIVKMAETKGINIFVLGIGMRNTSRLSTATSGLHCSHVFDSNTFDELDSLLTDIHDGICRAPRRILFTNGTAHQTAEVQINKTTPVYESLEHKAGGITIQTSVECGKVDIYAAFNTPNPSRSLHEISDTATETTPSSIHIEFSKDGSPLYVAYVGSHLPCTNGKRSGSKFTVTYTEGQRTDNTTSFCLTKECVLAASQVIQSMNYSTDPCEDFYEYACGGWLEKHTIPEDSSRFGTFTKLRRDLDVELRGLLEKPIVDSDIEAVKKTKRLYRACVNEDKIEEAGAEPLKKILKGLGGWPLLESSWDEHSFNLIDLLIKLKLFNNDLLMSWGVGEDDKVPDKHIIYFDQEGLGMPSREYYLVNRTDATLKAYEEIAVNAAIMLGADPTTARNDMKEVMDLEIQLAKITAPKEERRDEEKLYHKMTMEHLQNNVIRDLPFKWMDLVQGYFDHANITINDTTNVLVYQISYLEKLTGLLKTTNNRVIANYLISRFVRHRINNLGAKFRHLSDKYGELIRGVKVTPDRWKVCVGYVNSDILMGDVTGRMFIDKYFDEQSRDGAEALIADLRVSFKRIISNSDWMDNSTRSYALEKLAAIEEKVGFDDQLLNDTYLDESNKDWDFKENDYFGDVITALRQESIENMRKLEKDVDKTKWTSTPGVINAFYSPTKNRITFPAGILQAPFYDKTFPSSLNYGAIGMVIGHEMTHGFDDMGREFDKVGKLRQWWTQTSVEQFKSRAKCLDDQYSVYVDNGDHVKGDITLGENIADNGGMKIAYQAYEDLIARKGEETPLPGVGLTHRQLVFVAFAQAFCSKSTKQYEHLLITTNEHSPEKFRIQGTLSNNRDFAREFKCREGSTMNPNKKCSVW